MSVIGIFMMGLTFGQEEGNQSKTHSLAKMYPRPDACVESTTLAEKWYLTAQAVKAKQKCRIFVRLCSLHGKSIAMVGLGCFNTHIISVNW